MLVQYGLVRVMLVLAELGAGEKSRQNPAGWVIAALSKNYQFGSPPESRVVNEVWSTQVVHCAFFKGSIKGQCPAEEDPGLAQTWCRECPRGRPAG
ncbi:MAG: hypothetical protein HWN51_05720 [Desulfobacterales bacterium]|nr:hypothetical protein [Desulfobacterales bacterium]